MPSSIAAAGAGAPPPLPQASTTQGAQEAAFRSQAAELRQDQQVPDTAATEESARDRQERAVATDNPLGQNLDVTA